MKYVRKMLAASALTLALLAGADAAPPAATVNAPGHAVAEYAYKYGPYGSRQQASRKAYHLSRQGWKVKMIYQYGYWYVYAW
jgi:hypothetical protein